MKGILGDMQIKVAMLANSLTVNGISNVIKSYCENINSQKFYITILAGTPIDERYREFYQNIGIELIELPNRKEKTIAYYMALFKTMRSKHYHILHVHGNSVNSCVELFLAVLANVKIRIMHSHNTICNHPILHKILLPFFKIVCTDGFSCGTKAGEWIFGKDNFHVIPNGFVTEKYRFSLERRNRIRDELNLQNKLVIGHIGRINFQKNQIFLLEIFKYVAAKRNDAVLLLVGTGPYAERVSELVEQHPYRDCIILYGESNDTSAMYSAMDVFVFPSRFEGLPIVLLEAQMTGLPCIASDRITKEVDFGDILWKSIDNSPQKWADAILSINIKTCDRVSYYDKHFDVIKRYQISENVKVLENLYLEMYEREYKYN